MFGEVSNGRSIWSPKDFDLDLLKSQQGKYKGKKSSDFHKTFKFVKYDKLVPLLVEAIQEQQKQIEKLTEKIEELEEKWL